MTTNQNLYHFNLLTNPAACPQVVEGVKAIVEEMFVSAARVLWVEDPQRKN